ncbi:hypothetical protein AB0M86_45405 [Streptomyces sp. NPDC051639]|uniref:hypothetical protein n=1 Tax=Streptomyces sp. NPDC051639 TaxID=3155671 RepID=UPI0034317071
MNLTPAKRAIRTGIQTLLAVAALVPFVSTALASDDRLGDALPWLVASAPAAAALAAGFARVMALPAVEAFLDHFGIGLVDDGTNDQ